jgi:hypothetical protein
MTFEEFEQLKRDWLALGAARQTEIPRLRCFYCLKDLSDQAAYFSARLQAAVCSEHLR